MFGNGGADWFNIEEDKKDIDALILKQNGLIKNPQITPQDFEERIIDPNLASKGYTTATADIASFTHHNWLSTTGDDIKRLTPNVLSFLNNLNNQINENPDVLKNLIDAGDKNIIKYLTQDKKLTDINEINDELNTYPIETKTIIGYLASNIGYNGLIAQGVFSPTDFHKELQDYISKEYGKDIAPETLSTLVTALHLGKSSIYEKKYDAAGWLKRNTLGFVSGGWGNLVADGWNAKNIIYESLKDITTAGVFALGGIGATAGATALGVTNAIGLLAANIVGSATVGTLATKSGNELANATLKEQYKDYKNLQFDEDWNFKTLEKEVGENIAVSLLLIGGIKGVQATIKKWKDVKAWKEERFNKSTASDADVVNDVSKEGNVEDFDTAMDQTKEGVTKETVMQYAKKNNMEDPINLETLKRKGWDYIIKKGYEDLKTFPRKFYTNITELLAKEQNFPRQEGNLQDTYNETNTDVNIDRNEYFKYDADTRLKYGSGESTNTAQDYNIAEYNKFTKDYEVAKQIIETDMQLEFLTKGLTEQEFADVLTDNASSNQKVIEVRNRLFRLSKTFEDTINQQEKIRVDTINNINKARFGDKAKLEQPRTIKLLDNEVYMRQAYSPDIFNEIIQITKNADPIVEEFYNSIDQTKMLEGQQIRLIREAYNNNYENTQVNSVPLANLLGLPGETRLEVLNNLSKVMLNRKYEYANTLISGINEASKYSKLLKENVLKKQNLANKAQFIENELTELAKIDTPAKYRNIVNKEQEAKVKYKTAQDKLLDNKTNTLKQLKKLKDELPLTIKAETIALDKKFNTLKEKVLNDITEKETELNSFKTTIAEIEEKQIRYKEITKELTRINQTLRQKYPKDVYNKRLRIREIKKEIKDKRYSSLSTNKQSIKGKIEVREKQLNKLLDNKQSELDLYDRQKVEQFNQNKNILKLRNNIEQLEYKSLSYEDKLQELNSDYQNNITTLKNKQFASFEEFVAKKEEIINQKYDLLQKEIKDNALVLKKQQNQLKEMNEQLRQFYPEANIDLFRMEQSPFKLTAKEIEIIREMQKKAITGFTKEDMRAIISDLMQNRIDDLVSGGYSNDPLSFVGRRIIQFKNPNTALRILMKYSKNKLPSEIFNSSTKGTINNIARLNIAGLPENGNWADYGETLKKRMYETNRYVYGLGEERLREQGSKNIRNVISNTEKAIDYFTGRSFEGSKSLTTPNGISLLINSLYNSSALSGIAVSITVGDTISRAMTSNLFLNKSYFKTTMVNLINLFKSYNLTVEEARAIGLNMGAEHRRSAGIVELLNAIERDATITGLNKKSANVAKSTQQFYQAVTKEAKLTSNSEYGARLDVLEYIANNTDYTQGFWKRVIKSHNVSIEDIKSIQNLAIKNYIDGRNVINYNDIVNFGAPGQRLARAVEEFVRFSVPNLTLEDKINLLSNNSMGFLYRNLFLYKNIPFREFKDVWKQLDYFFKEGDYTNVTKVVVNSIFKATLETIFKNWAHLSSTELNKDSFVASVSKSSLVGPYFSMLFDLINSKNRGANVFNILEGSYAPILDFFTGSHNIASGNVRTEDTLRNLNRYNPVRNLPVIGELINRLLIDTIAKSLSPTAYNTINKRDKNLRKRGINPWLAN